MNHATISVDVGGTFTDAWVTADHQIATAKSQTTAENLSAGVLRALQQAAQKLGTDARTLLGHAAMVRYSTTVGLNRLLERKGPCLGLITTAGFEDTIFVGRGGQWADGLPVRERRNSARGRRPEPLISRALTVGVRERIDSLGRIVAPLDEQHVIDQVRELVRKGARGLVVSLLWSHLNAEHEQRVRAIVREHYPESYLGSMPIILSSEVLPKRDEYARTMTAVLDAYLHESLWQELGSLRGELSESGYEGPIMLVHASGGMAEVRKTSAVETCGGGPVAGLLGAAYLGRELGIEDLVLADMGGTSFDISVIEGGQPRSHLSRPLIDRWQVGICMLETQSIGAGGGSIARLDPVTAGRIEVGPDSAGSRPGPAAYGLGGTEPTVTDADVVLGYLNPERFHDGRLKLQPALARQAIEKRIAGPLALPLEEAAMLIRRVIDAKAGHALFKETALRGHDPRAFTLIACGGAGPTHGCGFGGFAEVKRVITPPYAPVFCAFGGAHMNLQHVYEQSRRFQLLAPGGKSWLEDWAAFNATVGTLEERARTDLRAEGLGVDEVRFSLELDAKFGGQLNSKRFRSPRLRLMSQADVEALYQAFADDYAHSYSKASLFPVGGAEIQHFVLRATSPQPEQRLERYPLGPAEPPASARRPSRRAFWSALGGYADTPVYEGPVLEPGNRIEGPAILEAPNTTTVLPPGWRYTVDEIRAGIMERTKP